MSDRHKVTLVLAGLLLVISVGCTDNKTNDRAVIDKGREVYIANCASCHGPNGEGQPDWKVQGPDGRYPAPPHDNGGHTWHHADGLLFRIVKYGGASLEIPNFESGMPAFEGRFSDEEIKALITYLRTLWGEKERQFQAEVSERDPFPVIAPSP